VSCCKITISGCFHPKFKIAFIWEFCQNVAIDYFKERIQKDLHMSLDFI
jgi:hypothetical protein